MSWLAVVIAVDADRAEALCDALLEAGALSVDLSDAHADTEDEQPLFAEPNVEAGGTWSRSVVRALFDERHNVAPCVQNALTAAGLDGVRPYEVERVADRDWVRATQAQFKPIHVSPRLWVVPTWHTAPDPAAINLLIDPGLAFGTGTHPTTHLCLTWLDAQIRGGESVLDYGCGSGILAIAAMKLGAASAIGVDIDPDALLAARHNAMQNRTAVDFQSAHVSSATICDIVVANILAQPLKVLAPLLARATRVGGRLALSGILDNQADEVSGVYREWYDMHDPQRAEDWVLLSGVRRARRS